MNDLPTNPPAAADAAARFLAETVTTNPGTPRSVLLEQAARCRALLADLLAADAGRWRVLILDRDPGDPRWLIACVTRASDVRAAALDSAARYQDWPEVTAWVAAQTGTQPALVPVLDALAWRIDDGQPR